MKLISITNQSKVWDKNFIRHVSVFGQSAIQANQGSRLVFIAESFSTWWSQVRFKCVACRVQSLEGQFFFVEIGSKIYTQKLKAEQMKMI